MSYDGLALSGTRDIYSSGSADGFVSKASHSEEYYSPENQINKTQRYNEMDFYRIQDGERKQPDYIIVFRENDEVKYMEEAKKAQEQWGGLPIVVVDKDKCLESERQKVEEMKQRYGAGEKDLAGLIYQKVRNNRVTRKNFCSEIDLEQFKEEIEIQKEQNEELQDNESVEQLLDKDEKEVRIKDLEKNYDNVTPQERKDEVSAIRKINSKIKEIVNQKEGEEVGRG